MYRKSQKTHLPNRFGKKHVNLQGRVLIKCGHWVKPQYIVEEDPTCGLCLNGPNRRGGRSLPAGPKLNTEIVLE